MNGTGMAKKETGRLRGRGLRAVLAALLAVAGIAACVNPLGMSEALSGPEEAPAYAPDGRRSVAEGADRDPLHSRGYL